ncbi:hypothetical protein DAPPUDRAFT_119543 [Daphnia pulex]|uniref:Uncharacterized protein n=1 Tax=Daphnia pulex TaxID=6669 RepID=E9HYT7_DAPPU|nr:hypothetical protein DAPPUDRAFT_119543 [Daphnia pulex]|eukprot:EFX63093.1 hypothetical protein DAPPUDRAFT_119543 [Daphnia pulex]
MALQGIRDHNAVKLLEADWALMDFQAYVNETVAGNSPNCGGLAMVFTREGYAGFTKFDDFSTVAVTPLRQPYRWCRESVLSAMGTAKEVGRRGLTVAVGQLSVESLTEVDYGLKMRDLLKEIVQLRLAFDNDGCLEMLKTSSMTSLQERERSRVLEVVLHETGESSVRKVVDWQCEAANVSYADSDAETVLATVCREELEPATSAVAQTRTNGAEWHRWAENVPHVDSEAETVPDTGPTRRRRDGRVVAVAAAERGTATNTSPPRDLVLGDKALRMTLTVDKHSDAATGNRSFGGSAERNSAITLSNVERNFWNGAFVYRNRNIRVGMHSVVAVERLISEKIVVFQITPATAAEIAGYMVCAPLPGRLKDFFVAPLSKESPMPWLLSDYVKPSFEEGRKADYLMGIAFIRMPVIALPPWLPAKIKPKKPKVSRGKAVGAIELVGKTTSEKGVATVVGSAKIPHGLTLTTSVPCDLEQAPMSTTATRYVLSAALSGPEHESFTGATTRQISKRKAAAADSFAPIRIKHAFVFEELISSHPRSSPYIMASLVTSEPFSTCVWGKLGAQCPDDESSNAGDSFKTNLLSATPESRLASGKGEVDVSKTLPPRSLTPPLVASQPRPSTSRNVTASSWSKVKTAPQKNLKPNSEGGTAPEMSNLPAVRTKGHM